MRKEKLHSLLGRIETQLHGGVICRRVLTHKHEPRVRRVHRGLPQRRSTKAAASHNARQMQRHCPVVAPRQQHKIVQREQEFGQQQDQAYSRRRLCRRRRVDGAQCAGIDSAGRQVSLQVGRVVITSRRSRVIVSRIHVLRLTESAYTLTTNDSKHL